MAIKWSAVKVSETMDEVEYQINLAEPFLVDAKAKAEEARNIANLPQYMDDRIRRLITDIERIDYVKGSMCKVNHCKVHHFEGVTIPRKEVIGWSSIEIRFLLSFLA